MTKTVIEFDGKQFRFHFVIHSFDEVKFFESTQLPNYNLTMNLTKKLFRIN